MLIAAGSALAMFEDDDFFKSFNEDDDDSFNRGFVGFNSGRSGGSFFTRNSGEDNVFGSNFFGG